MNQTIEQNIEYKKGPKTLLDHTLTTKRARLGQMRSKLTLIPHTFIEKILSCQQIQNLQRTEYCGCQFWDC